MLTLDDLKNLPPTTEFVVRGRHAIPPGWITSISKDQSGNDVVTLSSYLPASTFPLRCLEIHTPPVVVHIGPDEELKLRDVPTLINELAELTQRDASPQELRAVKIELELVQARKYLVRQGRQLQDIQRILNRRT